MSEKYDIVVHGATGGGVVNMTSLAIMMADSYLMGEDEDYELVEPMERAKLIKEELIVPNSCFPIYLSSSLAIGAAFVRSHDDANTVEDWMKGTAEISKDYGVRSSKYVLHEDIEISFEFIASFITGGINPGSSGEDQAGFDLTVFTEEEIKELSSGAIQMDVDDLDFEPTTVN